MRGEFAISRQRRGLVIARHQHHNKCTILDLIGDGVLVHAFGHLRSTPGCTVVHPPDVGGRHV
ncbi:hypothetical protein A5766_07940 [Gordonia sp. 852002-51296_SCH5728562-b]|nr:hypothetical protein A5766_07940 [Gordonia sp. 852002-51296_SCH5728562-b]